MKLDAIEKQSALWQKIEAEVKTRLEVFREKNDGNLPAQETDRLRGSIAMCKEMLTWAKEDPTITQ